MTFLSQLKLLLRKKVYGYETIKKYIPTGPLGNVLDMGCGNNPIFLEFNDNLESYCGIDPKVQNKNTSKIVLKRESINNIQLEELNKFDLILIIDVLHHLEKDHINDLLNKLTKLKEGTIIIIKDPFDDKIFSRTIHILHDLVINREYIHLDGSKLVKDILKDKIQEEIVKYNFWYRNIFFKIVI